MRKDCPSRLVRGTTGDHAVHGGGQWQHIGLDPKRIGEVVPADVNDPWYPPAPEVRAALQAAVDRVQHTPEVGSHQLEQRLAEELGVAPRSLLVGAGSSPILQHLITSVCGPDRPLLVTAPTYAEYERVAHLARAPVFRWLLSLDDDFAVRASELAAMAAFSGAGLVVLANPNNPTGRAASAQGLTALARSLPGGCLLLIDEAYIDQASEPSLLAAVRELPNLAVVQSFSKGAALGGVRVGYGVVGTLWSRALPWRTPPWPLSLFAQSAAIPALRAADYVCRKVEETRELRVRLQADLNHLPGVETLATDVHFFLVRLGDPWEGAQAVAEGLWKHGVLVKTCAVYGPPLNDRYLRITTRSAPENRRLLEALQRLLDEAPP